MSAPSIFTKLSEAKPFSEQERYKAWCRRIDKKLVDIKNLWPKDGPEEMPNSLKELIEAIELVEIARKPKDPTQTMPSFSDLSPKLNNQLRQAFNDYIAHLRKEGIPSSKDNRINVPELILSAVIQLLIPENEVTLQNDYNTGIIREVNKADGLASRAINTNDHYRQEHKRAAQKTINELLGL